MNLLFRTIFIEHKKDISVAKAEMDKTSVSWFLENGNVSIMIAKVE